MAEKVKKLITFLLKIAQNFEITVKQQFRKLGKFVGSYPWLNIVIPLCISIPLSTGFVRFKETNNVRIQFTPYNSPSHSEHAIAQKFLNDKGSLYSLWIIITPEDKNRSILEPKILEETYRMATYLQKGLHIEFNGKKHNFATICRSYCDLNDPLSIFMAAYKNKEHRNNTNFKFEYPIMEIFGESLYLANGLHGVKKDVHGKIKSATLAQLMFFSTTNRRRHVILSKWEKEVVRYVRNLKNKHIKLMVNSETLVEDEVRRTGLSMGPYLAVSFGIVITFTILTSLSVDVHRGKPWEAVFGVMCPIIATAASFGTLLFLGLEYQPIVTITLFLILGVGVDDVFLMFRAWHKSDQTLSVIERMGDTLAECGPSITITSLTNALSFGAGIFSQTPAIRTFCIYTATAVVFSYLLQITAFAGILALSGRREAKGVDPCCCRFRSQPQTNSNKTKWITDLQHRFLQNWVSLIVSWPIRIIGLFLLFAYWSIAIWGFSKLKVELTVTKLIMDDSPLHEFSRISMEQVWTETQQVSVIVNNPGDFRNESQLERIWSLVQDFESATHSAGPSSTQFWLDSYLKYLNFYNAEVTYEKLQEFLLGEDSKHWKANLILNRKKCIKDKPSCVQAFMFTTGFTNATQFSFRKQLLDEWRGICDKYAELQASPYEPQSFLADQVDSIKSTTISTVIIALIFMALVCLVFIPSLISIVCAGVCVLSINLGVTGFLVLWGVDLDPISMAALLMSIGFSVDYTAHMSYHFYKAEAKTNTERLAHAYDSIALPTIQAGLSTVLVISVLIIHRSYMISVFVKTFILVVSFGWIHGLFILPLFLAALTFRKNSSSNSNGVEIMGTEERNGTSNGAVKSGTVELKIQKET